MAITILPPVAAEPQVQPHYESDSEDEVMESSDIARPSKRLRLLEKGSEIVTPGEIVTDDPQWMRLVLLLWGVYRTRRSVVYPNESEH